jgi:predicted XRE-type DNA-binding protein
MNDDFEIIRGSGNVFHDFAYANANLEQARAIIAKEIIQTLDDRGLSIRDAEKLTGVAHSEFSRIRNAKLSRFTLDRMITIFGKLAEDVEVNVSFRPRHHEEQNGLWLNMPKSLHSSLTENAVQEGVPLDTWVLTVLSEKASASNLSDKFEALTNVIKTESTITKELLKRNNTAITTLAMNTIISSTSTSPQSDLPSRRTSSTSSSVPTVGTC